MNPTSLFRAVAAMASATSVLCASAHPVLALNDPPEACRNDLNQAVMPPPNGWAFVINFNPASGMFHACIVQTPMGKPTFSIVACRPFGAIDVSGGSASFPPGAHLDCAFNISQVAGKSAYIAYDNFWAQADVDTSLASTGGMPGTFAIFSHPSASMTMHARPTHHSLTTRLGANLHAGLGAFPFSDQSVVTTFWSGEVKHYRSLMQIDQMQGVPSFAFSAFPATLVIGDPGSVTGFVLHQLIIDPAGYCC